MPINPGGGKKIQIQGTQDNGTVVDIPVTSEGHMEVAIHSPRLPFGSVHVESLIPEFQVDPVYGINVTEVVTQTGNSSDPVGSTSATVTAASNLFTCATGTTANSFGLLQSRKRLRYRPGEGVVGRFTALFSTPAANSTMFAGFGTTEAGLFWGYNGTSFGILHSTGGVREIQTLTVTTASTATNDYNVQLAGTTYNVTATNNGSTVKTAYEISKGTYAGWKAVQRGSTVIFLADTAGNKTGTFSLAQSGAATPAAGSFVETLAGVATTPTWIPQSSWNGDKLDGTGASGVTLDPTKGNVFQINVQYLGFGAITFMVEVGGANQNNPDFVVCHVIKAPNSRTTPTLVQPAFPFYMGAFSSGSTTNVSVSCGSFAGFTEGEKRIIGPRMCPFVETNGFVGSTAATYYPLFTIRNDLTHSHSGNTDRANMSVVYPVSISCSHDDATPVTFYVIKNATLNGTPNFSRFSTSSCLYWDTASTTCSYSLNEQVIFAFTLAQNGGGAYAFADRSSLQPGETLTLAARAVTGTATYVNASLNTREDQ